MTIASTNDDDGLVGAGGASLAGYEYQIDASVWLALDLVLVSRLTSALQLEPASQEDLECELSNDEPARAVSRVNLNGYTLIVQVKRRGGDAWTPNTLKSLLQHGSDTRPSAANRLTSSEARYLLITSAGLNGDARKLKIRRAGNWPKPAVLPDALADVLPTNAAGRIAIIANEDDERLRTDIERLLTEGCRVPNANLEACRGKLREEARSRIAGAGGGMWRREDLEDLIREHAGYLASSPELEHYVHPTNWGDLRGAMRERSSALIIGQSGTGKTLATRQLYDELRTEIPGLTRVPIRLGPHELRDDRTPSPVLYDIEDPWGRFDFDPKSRPWNDQLSGILANATPGRMIVATSRLDVAQVSKALDVVAPWVVKLEAEHYGRAERNRLYRSRIDGLPRELRPHARAAERDVLDELETPLEIQKFFDALRTLDRTGLKNPPAFISDAIRSAHQNSIESTVIEQIEERNDVRAAAVIWGMFKASDKLSRSVLRHIEDGLADLDPAMEPGVSPLVDFFVAARNLRQGDAHVVTYYHPRVEAGIEKVMSSHRQKVRHTLAHLLDLLVSEDGPGEEWGTGAATRILAASRKHFSVRASNAAATRIDAWLEAQLAEEDNALEEYLDLAAEAGSSSSNSAELARFLRYRTDRLFFPGFDTWGAPDRSDAWYNARRTDPGTKPLVEAFIRQLLPSERVAYPASFASDLEPIASDLSGAFLDAAERTVGSGFMEADKAIAQGALQNLAGFERIVDAAVAELTQSEEDQRQSAVTRLEVLNEVHNEDYAQYLAEDDHGHTAGVYISAYVKRVRAVDGWRSLVIHRHAGALLGDWLGLLAKQAQIEALDPDELQGVFNAAYGSDHEEALWSLIQLIRNSSFLPDLRDRIIKGHADKDVAEAALTCLIEIAPDVFKDVAEELAANGCINRLVEIAIELASLRQQCGNEGKQGDVATAAAAQALPSPFKDLCDQVLVMKFEGKPELSSIAQFTLAGITDPSEAVRHLRVELAAIASLEVKDDVRWLLANSDEMSRAVDALEAAIRLDMAADLEAALDHKFAHVRARALTTLGERETAPLTAPLLAKASDIGSPVRKALVSLLKKKMHVEHLDAVMTLTKDDWSSDTRHYGDDADFPIAQDAVEVLEQIAQLTPLPLDDAHKLFAIGLDTADPDVRLPIFRMLAASGDLELQNKLFDLAINPGKASIRRAAADALVQSAEAIATDIVDNITARLLSTRYEPVAASLSLLLACRGDPEKVRAIAVELATNKRRRVLILLLIWILIDRDSQIAQDLVAMLPTGHAAVVWALGGEIDAPNDNLLADLGDPAVCDRVLVYMRRKT